LCGVIAKPQPTEWQHIGNQIDAAFIFARADLVSVHRVVAFILCSQVNDRSNSRYVSAVKKNSRLLGRQFLQSKRQKRRSKKTILTLSKPPRR
jgi:hypothetical protein